MKTLYLVRHAKSSWEHVGLDDTDRPLKTSGVNDAYTISTYLKKNNILPDQMISSPAVRALSTALIFARQMGYNEGEINLYKDLYESTPEEILNVIKKTGDTVNSLMVFGHDPSLTNLFILLTEKTILKIPTSAIAAISLNIDYWNKNILAKGNLQFLYKPKEIRAMLNNS